MISCYTNQNSNSFLDAIIVDRPTMLVILACLFDGALVRCL